MYEAELVQFFATLVYHFTTTQIYLGDPLEGPEP